MGIVAETLRKSISRRRTLPSGEKVTVHGYEYGWMAKDERRNSWDDRFVDKSIPGKKAAAERSWGRVQGPVHVCRHLEDNCDGYPVHRVDRPMSAAIHYDCDPLPGECVGWLYGKKVVSTQDHERIQEQIRLHREKLIASQIEEADQARGEVFSGLEERLQGWILQLRQLVDDRPEEKGADRYRRIDAWLNELDESPDTDGIDLRLPSTAIVVALRWTLPNYGGRVFLNEERTSWTHREEIGESRTMQNWIDRAVSKLPKMTVWHCSVPTEGGQDRMYHPAIDGEAPFPAAYRKAATVMPDREGWYRPEHAWSLTNSIDKHWSKSTGVHSVLGTYVRSTSTGDVVQLPNGELYRAESCGWKRIELARELKIDDAVVGFVRHDATPAEIATGKAMLPGSDKWVRS